MYSWFEVINSLETYFHIILHCLTMIDCNYLTMMICLNHWFFISLNLEVDSFKFHMSITHVFMIWSYQFIGDIFAYLHCLTMIDCNYLTMMICLNHWFFISLNLEVDYFKFHMCITHVFMIWSYQFIGDIFAYLHCLTMIDCNYLTMMICLNHWFFISLYENVWLV